MPEDKRELTTKDIFNPAPSGEEPLSIEDVAEVVRCLALTFRSMLGATQIATAEARDLLTEVTRIQYPTGEGGPNVKLHPEHAKHLIVAASALCTGATTSRWSWHEVESDLREGFNEIVRLAAVQDSQIEKLQEELAASYATQEGLVAELDDERDSKHAAEALLEEAKRA